MELFGSNFPHLKLDATSDRGISASGTFAKCHAPCSSTDQPRFGSDRYTVTNYSRDKLKGREGSY